ncbi:tight adherence protein B [Lentzea fradiae]|uniref:Tight adherence protein B n=1 Tax=Lentzea fradiae TaxID=200378 RepID=A0A1G8ARI1_9PSEU|nr:type II secretion system F family protein [Lentzea fradiae]SDH23527.1 tight adherence protein B [Lentzea fradiae]
MLSLLFLATALLIAPQFTPVRRLRPKDKREVVVPQLVWVGLAAVLLYLAADVGGLIAGVVLGAVIYRGVRRSRRAKELRAATEGLSDGLGGVVDELRAGAHPAAAAEGAAQDAPKPASDVLRAVAATARMGGDVERTLRDLKQPLLDTDRLARAWHVSAKHGVALADVLDATRRDLDEQSAFARQVNARMAGPRASAAVLAGLPVLGLLLGELSGARPLHVLTGTAAGQGLLVLGAVFLAVGLWWTRRITEVRS